MTVKNIVFSGFMAAVLMWTVGANANETNATTTGAKYTFATASYVDRTVADGVDGLASVADLNTAKEELSGQIAKKEDVDNKLTVESVSNDDLTTEKYMSAYTTSRYVQAQMSGAFDDEGAITTAVKEAIADAVTNGEVGTAIAGAVQAEVETQISGKQDKLTDANAGTAISITEQDGTVKINNTYNHDSLMGVPVENNCTAVSELCVLTKTKNGTLEWTEVTQPLNEK